MHKIILASQSPRRKQLLEWAEVPFEIVVRSTDESYPAVLAVEEIPIYIAREKGVQVKKLLSDTAFRSTHPEIILAADTVVVLDGEIIGKPTDRDDAIRILSALSGKTHKVITGVVILHPGGEFAFSEVTYVHFHPLTFQQIEFYIDKYQPFDKAGAYAIQEWIGVVGIKSIHGDFYNVMGLPVSKVVQVLKTLNSIE